MRDNTLKTRVHQARLDLETNRFRLEGVRAGLLMLIQDAAGDVPLNPDLVIQFAYLLLETIEGIERRGELASAVLADCWRNVREDAQDD